MFKLDLSPTYSYPVELPVVDERGKSQTHKITIKFRRLPREQLVDINKTDNDGGQRDGGQVVEADVDYLLQFVDGWAGVGDDSGDDLPFNRDNLRALLNAVPAASTAITSAFFEAQAGGQRRKN